MAEKSPVTTQAFVGLDLSIAGSGLCMKRGAELQMTTVKTTPKTAANNLERLRYVRQQVLDFIPVDTVMVCVEDFFVPHRPHQINAAVKLIMIGSLVRVAVLEKGLPFYVVSPGQLKKYATGKGNGPKSVVIREIYKRWGVEAKDDNQADACVLAHIAEAIFNQPGFQLHKYQEDVVKKVMGEAPQYNV